MMARQMDRTQASLMGLEGRAERRLMDAIDRQEERARIELIIASGDTIKASI